MTSDRVKKNKEQLLASLKNLKIISPKLIAEYEDVFLKRGLFPLDWTTAVETSEKINSRTKDFIFALAKRAVDIRIPKPREPFTTKRYTDCNPITPSEISEDDVAPKKRCRKVKTNKKQNGIKLPPPKTQHAICSDYSSREIAQSILSDAIRKTLKNNEGKLSLSELGKRVVAILTDYKLELENKSTILLLNTDGIAFASYDGSELKIDD
jgi:hypothetical protein